MEAVQRGMVQGRRRVGVLLAVVLFASSATPADQRVVAQPGSPVGDQWWQDAVNPASPPASAGDRWWQDPRFAGPSVAVPQRSDTRVRTY